MQAQAGAAVKTDNKEEKQLPKTRTSGHMRLETADERQRDTAPATLTHQQPIK
jgi:hypothetical protein